MNYEPAIGLEVHAHLLTASKIFCSCRASYGLDPNSSTCPVCLGLPGALPVLNRAAVAMAMKLILAVGGNVGNQSVFARKNYFYPDLPKGYQISQYDQPVGAGGRIEFDSEGTHPTIRLTRIHLEEDAGKSLHPESTADDYTRVDMNRCGVPLVEIVTEPDIRSPKEAGLCLRHLKQIVEYLGICDGNMDEGSFRCDANVSLRPVGQKTLGTKTEVKNMNSVKAVERALTFEIERQTAVLLKGGEVVQQTLLYDEKTGRCSPMRSKEESHDYRYFPDPDLVSLKIDESWIKEVMTTLPELPAARVNRISNHYGIPLYDAQVLTTTRQLADYFEESAKISGDAKLSSNWIMTEVMAQTKEAEGDIRLFPISPRRLGELIAKVGAGEITGKIGKELFHMMLTDDRDVATLLAVGGHEPITGTAELEKLVEKVLHDNPVELEKYRKGKKKLLSFFVGQVMKVTSGLADPVVVSDLLKRKIE